MNKQGEKQLFLKVREFSLLTNAKGIELSVEHENKSVWNFWEKHVFEMDVDFRHYFCNLK
ncbi:hypothetical protein [Bacillus solimangrovi]|nr:hypothetical protein [Bacillus solimangrovi]